MEQNKRTSGLSLLFALTFILTLAVLIQDFRFDRSLARERGSAISLDRQIGELERATSDLRAAQTGYLATGQGPEFWMRQATELLDRLRSGVTLLRESSRSEEAARRYSAASAALADVAGIDVRARENIRRDQRFLASDLVFMEGLEATERLTGELAVAKTAEMQAAESRIAFISRLRFGMNAVAIAFVLVVALYASRAAARAPASPAATMAQMLRELPPPVKPAVSPAIRPSGATTPSVVNLPDAADLCVDLARVIDGRDIPALLGRAAKVLEAKGVIIWVADESGSLLLPSLSHGYSEKMLARLAALEIGADNVTSLSFRSMRPQTMNGAGPGSSGAIAVPLVTAAGCTGVLAAEVRDSKPASEAVAVAKIIAAQFATLIAPGDLATAKTAEA